MSLQLPRCLFLNQSIILLEAKTLRRSLRPAFDWVEGFK